MRWLRTLFFLSCAVMLASTAGADWDPGQPAKWVQRPDLSPLGIDVRASEEFLLADDFECTATGPITGIHIWGSWLGDILPQGNPRNVIFTLSIHKDIPADQSGTGYSIPGDLLWIREFQPSEFAVRIFAEGIDEGWMEPPDEYFFPADHVCWQYNFSIPPGEAFRQEGTPDEPVIYWLDVQARPLEPAALFGWKTSPDHWNDDAVWGRGIEPYLGPWGELRYPPNHEQFGQSIDLAFVITGEEEPPQEFDFGDAPDPTYPTRLANNGAFHAIVPGIFLGATIDSEPDGQPHPAAMGDDNDGNDDEDGVVFTSAILRGGIAKLTVTASAPGFLDGWVDFGIDGGWGESGDQVFAAVPLSPGPNYLNFPVPASANLGPTFARFRYNTGGGLPFDGPAPDGEVEDYRVFLREEGQGFKWQQYPDLEPTGIDVDASYQFILADDFRCDETGYLTTVDVWGSWFLDILPEGIDPNGVTFTLSIHEDIPAEQSPTGYSMPGEVLWWRDFQPGAFESVIWAHPIEEGWLDLPDGYLFPGDWTCWLYRFRIPQEDAFLQVGNPDDPVVYWLDVKANPVDGAARFGWKTSVEHWNDDAVFGVGMEPYPGPWDELRYPPPHPLHPESIDLAFRLFSEPVEEDFGDAPDPTYPTLLGSNGARHVVSPNIFLGAGIDPDPNGQPDPNALGDDNDGNDDEDGIVFTTGLVQGNPASFDVTASVNGFLSLWLDFDGDGSWAEAGDQIFAGQPIPAGTSSLGFVVPGTAAVGPTFLRARFTRAGALPFYGPAPNGEVEDYRVHIGEQAMFKWEQPPDLSPFGIDVNASEDLILADDFLCRQTGPLTHIRIWGSWFMDELPLGQDPTAVQFTISLHRDIPAEESPTGYSMPGEPRWWREFLPGQFEASPWFQGEEGWMDPPDGYIFPADFTCWVYDFYLDPEETFVQLGSDEHPIVYWVDVKAVPLDPGTRFGWKTSVEHWNDDAVFGFGMEPYPGPWDELRYPPGHPFHPESIDLAFLLEGERAEQDFGDAPDPTYPTLLASNGARHVIFPGMFLGNGIDSEPDGQPGPNALRDDNIGIDDEDGVTFLTPLDPGSPAQVDVVASTAGFLDAWVDFHADGSWAEPGDQIFAAVPLVPGSNVLSFPVTVTDQTGHDTFARFRFSASGGLSYDGPARRGEVEDYKVRIEDDLTAVPDGSLPTQVRLYRNMPNPFDGTTTFRFDLPVAERVSLAIYGVDGSYVATLIDDEVPAGRHVEEWNGRTDSGQPVPSGTYFCRFRAGSYEESYRVVLNR